MKKRFIMLLVSLLAVISIRVPAMAEAYGRVYDETDELWTADLESMGTDMGWMADFYGLDLWVDILIDSDDGYTVQEVAESLYYYYDYGEGEGLNGITLTILLDYDENGYALKSNDDWCVYAGGESIELTEDVTDEIRNSLLEKLNPEAFAGDIESDKLAMTEVVYTFHEDVENMLLSGRFSNTIYDPEGIGRLDTMTEEPYEVDAAEGENGMYYVTDAAYLLTDDEWYELEALAQEVSEKHNCGIYIITVDDYTEFGYDSISEAAYSIYHDYDYGMGPDRNGALLFLNMNDRDYATFFYGTVEGKGNAFNDYSQKLMEDEFLGYLGDNDWYNAFKGFINVCDEYLILAENGTPVKESLAVKIGTSIGIALPIGAIIAIIVCFILKMGMKSVKKGAVADAYVIDGGLKLTGSSDLYTHTTETRRKIEKSSGGGGGSSSYSGGGGSGRSGKF